MSVFLSSYHFHNYKKSTETDPPHNEVKGEGLISRDAITNISRQRSLEFIIQ
jgi:hypothetical protein